MRESGVGAGVTASLWGVTWEPTLLLLLGRKSTPCWVTPGLRRVPRIPTLLLLLLGRVTTPLRGVTRVSGVAHYGKL